MKKKNLIKDMKRMGIVPRNRHYRQMKLVLITITIMAFLAISFYGMWKYPTPGHYYDNINHPAYQYNPVGLLAFDDDEVPECGNYPYHWHNTPNQWSYHNYV